MTSIDEGPGSDALDQARAEMATLVRLYGGRLFSQALIFVRADDAEDVVQEAFMRFWKQQYVAQQPERSRNPLGLLRQQVHDLAVEARRRGRRRGSLLQDIGATVTQLFSVHSSSPLISAVHGWVRPDEWLDRDDVDPILHQAIGTLPPKRRDIFLYVHSQDLSYAEVAALLRKSEAYVRSACSVAAEHLRKTLHTMGYAPPPGFEWKQRHEARGKRRTSLAMSQASEDKQGSSSIEEGT